MLKSTQPTSNGARRSADGSIACRGPTFGLAAISEPSPDTSPPTPVKPGWSGTGFLPVDEAMPMPPGNPFAPTLCSLSRARIDRLAPRQRDVLAGLIDGHSNKLIARMLGISPRTVEIYRVKMMERLEARTLAQALHIAFLAGLAPAETASAGTD